MRASVYNPSILRHEDCWVLAGRSWGVKLEVFEHLLRMNAGFDQAIRSLRALRKHSGFHGGMLARFTALSKETRAEANSYLASVIETSETKQAGRRFRKRKAQERVDEQGD
jgi:hypothetical protein